jgi:hypothetical protein
VQGPGVRDDYWPLSLVVPVAPGEADEPVPLPDDIEPDDGDEDDVPPGVDDEPDVEPVPEDVEPDDVEPADEPVDDGGVVVDDEEDPGVTVGGVVEDVFDSRWQPATPSARPVQSTVIKVALLIVNLQRG